MKQLLTFSFMVITLNSFGQRIDSVMVSVDTFGGHVDTLFMMTENPLGKNSFLGNSWCFSASYSLSKSTEFGLKLPKSHLMELSLGRTIGRSFGGGGGFYLNTTSYGLGYARLFKGKERANYYSCFGELSSFFVPPGTVRLDFITSDQFDEHYIRTSFGLSLIFIDLLYGYSFGFQETKNFTHSFIFRFKLFRNIENWQHTYPSRC